MKYRLGDARVETHPQSWVAPNAVLVGRVKLEEGASVWFNAVLRGENELILLGQIAGIALGVVHVVSRTRLEHFLLRLGQFTHNLAGRTHDQRTVGDLLAFTDQRIGADDAVLADLRTVEDHRVDPDQAVVAHGAAMQHRVVTDGHAGANGQRIAHVGVHHGAVLDVAVLADQDQFVVAAQHSVEPDVGALFQFDLAHQHGIGCDPALWVGFDAGVAQTVFHRDFPQGSGSRVFRPFERWLRY